MTNLKKEIIIQYLDLQYYKLKKFKYWTGMQMTWLTRKLFIYWFIYLGSTGKATLCKGINKKLNKTKSRKYNGSS